MLGCRGYADVAMTRVAIVDDHEGLRERLAALLTEHGMEVSGAAGTAAAGLDLVERTAPDLAVVDAELPDGSGIDLTRRMLAVRPDLAVLVYSALGDAGLVYSALESGARGFVSKAASTAVLLGAIDSIVAGDAYVDPQALPTPDRPQLSPRERDIVHLLAEGRSVDEVADALGESVELVRARVRRLERNFQGGAGPAA
jgi:DNA-binding NarL/FixJ family response regulator